MNPMNVPLDILILMSDSQAGQVEGLFSFPEMPFFHDQIVVTMGLSVMSSPGLTVQNLTKFGTFEAGWAVVLKWSVRFYIDKENQYCCARTLKVLIPGMENSGAARYIIYFVHGSFSTKAKEK